MGEKRGMARMLLECSLSDKSCVVQEKQYEVIIVPTFLVGVFLILLAVILWLFMREQRSQQQRPGLRGSAAEPPTRSPSLEATGHGGKVLMPLKETSVESFLRAATSALAKLQVPREQLSDVLEQIYNGSYGIIYRAKMYSGDLDKPKNIVLKTLKGKRRNVRLPFPFYFSIVNS